MNKTKLEIINLLEPYLEKDLHYWCILKYKTFYYIIDNLCVIKKEKWELIFNDVELWKIGNIKDCEILGHFDLTGVINFIEKKLPVYNIIMINKKFYIKYESNKQQEEISFPNKPLELFTEDEIKELLKSLLKL